MSETANSPETEDRLQPNFGRIRLALRFEVCRWRSLATFSSILTALARYLRRSPLLKSHLYIWRKLGMAPASGVDPH